MSGINEQVIEAEIYQIGPQGIPGEAATISVGTVTTGAAGTDASVINSGTPSAAVLDFVIPQGAQGLQGIQGPQGIQGLTGATGNGIASIVKTGTVGLVDTYRITFTDNTYFDFDVTNGSSISDIEKTGTSGLVDTYTITLTNGDTHTFTVTNGAQGEKGETGEVGNGILGVNKMSTTGLVDNYRMTFTNGTYFDFDVTNAKSIVSIAKISTSGLIDTYRITFNDSSYFNFPVTNGNGVSGVTLLSWVGLDKTYRMTFTNGTYFDFTVSNGAEGQAEWGGISGVLSNQHDLQDALDLKADTSQTHALKSYSDNGELLTDAEGLADVKGYAHSTFDRSKFTVTGSPVITDDGIASGFSYSKFLSIPNINLGDTFEICQFITVASVQQQYLFSIQGDRYLQLYLNASNILRCEVGTGGDTWTYSQPGTHALSVGNSYFIRTYYNNGNYKVDISSDGLTWTNEITITSASQIITGTHTLVLCSQRSLGSNFTGTIDLKQFSITVDNIPVFSGNKTGIDTIKPDDYTVVGTPTISADGVLSNCSASDYLTASNIDLTSANEVILETVYTAPTSAPGTDATNTCLRCGIMAVGSRTTTTTMSLRAMAPGLYSYQDALTNLPYDGSTYVIQGVFTGLKTESPSYYCRVRKITDTTWIRSAGEVKTALAGQTTADVKMGMYSSSFVYALANGKSDLSGNKIYVDGDLVYQPCLKIPYTLSKTGSKVVNSVYRDRVNDMAEQFGYANYYTLSDTDFTLPQGEVYGLIGQRTLKASYRNGISYWELWSDRTLEQGGTCTSGVEYTLLKPFTDTNYVLTIPYTSKTATTFIPSATGDFIAKGVGTL